MFVRSKRNYSKGMAIMFNLFLLSILAIVNEASRGDIELPYYDVCTKPECVRFANFLNSNMNKTADPCSDFYNYACGGWIQNHSLSALSVVDRYSDWTATIHDRLIDILETPAQPGDPEALTKAKRVYNMCKGQLDDSGLDSLKNLYQHLGGWPIITFPNNAWNSDGSITWQHVSKLIDNYKFDTPLYSLGITEDFRYFKRNVTLHPPKTLFKMYEPRQSQLNNGARIIRSVIAHLAPNALAQPSLEQDISNIFEFARKLRQIVPTNDDIKSLSIAKMQQEYDERKKLLQSQNAQINWLNMIRDAFGIQDLSDSEVIIVTKMSYFLNLSKLLDDTPARTIVNYIIWFLTIKVLNFTDETFQILNNFPFNGIQRKIRCVDEPNLKHALAYQYIKKYSSNASKVAAKDYIGQVKNELMNQIANSHWIDDETKERAKAKLQNVKIQVVGPEWYSDAAIDNYYKELHVNGNYFDNIMNILKFEKRADGKLLSRPLNITRTENHEWNILDPLTVNAMYRDGANTFCIPAVVLDDYYYHKDRPAALIFGLLGFIAGHEISHSLDPVGIRYDKDGFNRDWWSPATIATYHNKTNCLVRQYNKYYIPEIHQNVNGQETLNENFADAGIRTAYKAFKHFLDNHESQDLGLAKMENFSSDKLFFLTYASLRCQRITSQAARVIISESHSPARYRLIGSLSNMPEFARVFGCQLGSPMNPVDKCQLWEN